MSFPDPPQHLPGLLRRAARYFPDRTVAVFDRRGRRAERRTFVELAEWARISAGRWSALGLRPGERVLVAAPLGWDWMDAWLGVSLLGALPVAVAPPAGLGGAASQLDRIRELSDRLDARFVFAADGLQRALPVEDELRDRVVTPAALEETTVHSTAPVLDDPDPESTAFLQLTSGSTGFSRAVCCPHRALVHNSIANDEAIGVPYGAPVHEWAGSMVSWLPLHHDMGLIGCLFLPLYAGLDLELLPPSSFLARPRLWLERLAARPDKVFAPAPNFGYQLCLERLEPADREGLDLSRWHDALTGAEMVRPETVHGFAEAFAPHGFRAEAFRPCYGMAEATLSLTFDLEGRGLRTAPLPAEVRESVSSGLALSEVACVGRPVRDTRIEIRGADGRALADGRVGEVCANGPGIFSGYYGDPEATAEGLADGWLQTGDLGFVRDGELYITGRTKDVLILRGHNLMPHELEWLVEAETGGGGAARSAAFAVATDARGEQAVLVVECEPSWRDRLDELETGIRRRIGRALGLPVAEVVFVRRGRLPKTSSGKVRRRQVREDYLCGRLERLVPLADG